MIAYNKLHENLNSWRAGIFLHSDSKASFLLIHVKGSLELAISNNTLAYNYPGRYL